MATPHDFLLGPGPRVRKGDVDFRYTELSEYEGRYATVLDNVLTKEECDTLVRAAEAQSNGTWEQAMINIGGGAQALMTDSRDCGRIIWDDSEVVERIWSRVKGSVPEIEYLKGMARVTGNGPVKRGETWKMTRLNERMRFLKYGEGQYFKPHHDGCYVTPEGQEISFYTLHLYLNESTPENKLEGGATTFHSHDMQRSLDVDPKVGRVLIFQHRDLLHSGADVTRGIKLTLRTDLMYVSGSGV
ncbi:MAG: hypothetical protein ASARMPREDX12_005317 [Alectoria sarmentosa]|nr:MAG: hypothetical protein ASARMPRED_000500 [Alectoria sarmentosa]CAD6572589.1 MAG: hypothetical protein ASARMPREDX12_005317 [Alectoria sarmentosa]